MAHDAEILDREHPQALKQVSAGQAWIRCRSRQWRHRRWSYSRVIRQVNPLIDTRGRSGTGRDAMALHGQSADES